MSISSEISTLQKLIRAEEQKVLVGRNEKSTGMVEDAEAAIKAYGARIAELRPLIEQVPGPSGEMVGCAKCSAPIWPESAPLCDKCKSA